MRFDTALIVFTSLVPAAKGQDRFLRQRVLDGGSTTRTVSSLQEVIIRDMMPSASTICARRSVASTFTFESSQSVSQWDAKFVDLEQYVFQAKMAHTDTNSNRTWTMRLGTGGNIYSLVGAMGETVPPQKRTDSPWMDEVWQAVIPLGVNGDHDSNPATLPYFIHEAGTYQRDGAYTTIPFYSPSLGKYCDDANGECGFISWGQQAHLPTDLKSDILYMNRYVNCGDGVIEHVNIRHNNLGGNPGYTYSMVEAPWGGTRKTVLKDLVLTNAQSQSLELIYPLNDWSVIKTRKLRNTMGFTVFAEDLPKSSPLHDTPYLLPTGMVLKIAASGCIDNDSARYKCTLEATTSTSLPNAAAPGVLVTLVGSGGSFVAGLRHLAYSGRYLFFYKDSAITLQTVQTALRAGDTVQVLYYLPPSGKAPDQNLALGHVHGAATVPTANLVRYGTTSRDYNVYNVRANLGLAPGDTYFYRQYFLFDAYTEMAAKGTTWAAQTTSQKNTAGSRAGRTISLYSNNANNFGYVLADGTCNRGGNVTLVCQGSTTPQPAARALFQVQCNDSVVVSFDPYYFTPPGSPIRSYQCYGEAIGTRPKWSLLGFFNSDCAAISSGYQLNEQLCGVTTINV